MRLGDLVSLSFRIFRLNWRIVTSRLFWPSLLTSLSVSGVQMAIVHWVKASKSGNFFTYDALFILLGGIIILGAFFVLSLRSVGVYREIFRIDPTFTDAMKYAWRRMWSIFVIYSMGTVVPFIVAGFLLVALTFTILLKQLGPLAQLLIVPLAFVEGILLVVIVALTVLVTTLLFAVVASENISVSRVYSRSIELAFSYPLRGGSFVCLLGVSIFLIMLAASIFMTPSEIYETVKASSTGELIDTPFYLRVLETASSTINNVISMGIAIIASGLYYRDVLFRREGADLVEEIARLEGRSSI